MILLALFNTLGRILTGYVSDRLGRARTMVLVFVIQAANMLAFAAYTTPLLLAFGAAMTGLCYGAIYALMPAATADAYGLRNLGANYGLLFTAFGVAGTVGPMLGGRMRDVVGSYSPSYLLSAGMLLAATGLAATLRQRVTAGAAALPQPTIPAAEPSG